MEALEREVLELPLDRVDPQPVRQRRVDLERFARFLDLLLLGQRRDRAHVVEAVGELDQDDPDVRGHRHHHLPVVLGLTLVAALERDARELGDAVDELGDRLAELLLDLIEAGARVLDGVVQQRRAQRLGVETQPRADLGGLDGMGDEVLARPAALVGMTLAGEGECPLHGLRVNRSHAVVAVLGDHREQVAQQRPLVIGQLGRQPACRCRGGIRPMSRANPRVALAVDRGLLTVGPAAPLPPHLHLLAPGRLWPSDIAGGARAILRHGALRPLRLV